MISGGGDGDQARTDAHARCSRGEVPRSCHGRGCASDIPGQNLSPIRSALAVRGRRFPARPPLRAGRGGAGAPGPGLWGVSARLGARPPSRQDTSQQPDWDPSLPRGLRRPGPHLALCWQPQAGRSQRRTLWASACSDVPRTRSGARTQARAWTPGGACGGGGAAHVAGGGGGGRPGAAPGSSPETPARAVVHRRTHAASAQTTPQPGAGGDASRMGVPTPPGPGRLDRSPWGAPSQEPAPHTTRFIPSSVPSCRLHFPKISPFLLPVSPPRLQRPLLPAEAGPSGSGSRAPEAPAFGLTDGVLGPTGRQSPPSAASGCGRPGHPAAWALNPAARRRQRRFTPNPETHVSHR